MNTPSDSIDGHKGPFYCPLCAALKGPLCRAMDWIDDRTGFRSAVRWFADRPVAGRFRWKTFWPSLWPSMIVFTFLVQVITGFFLWMFYSPSAQTAWESVYYLQYEVAGGWLLRGIHHYAAQMLVALCGLYVICMIIRRLYRAGRECVYWVAVLLGLFSLGLCLTGDLLAWDQNSYASTLVRTKFLLLLPFIGDDLFKLAAGGPQFGHLTLTRFFALHVGLFATGFFVLLVVHGWLVHWADSTVKEADKPDGRYWPDQLARHAAGWLAVMVVVGLLVGRHAFSGDSRGQAPGDYLGVALGAPADPDPANFYAAARPEWSFRSLYQLSNMFPGDAMPIVGVSWKIMPIFVIPGLLMLVVLSIPFIGRLKRGYWINVAVLAFLLGAIVLLSAASWRHDFADPEHKAALADGVAQAERAKQLARSPQGIPVAGALSLLRTDPKMQGPKIYKKQCAVCHGYSGPEEKAKGSDTSSAPDLYRFASREWLTDFFDPGKVKGLEYYGNTKFASGVMARYVEGPFSELDKEDQKAIIVALSAEARLRSQHELDSTDTNLIEKGTGLITGGECTRCHRFHDHGSLGHAPDLTGYGSREWAMGIVIDPTHHWFYGQRNDRMPTYLELPEEPEKNRMAAGDVALVVDWLRGDWYEPADSKAAAAAEENGVAKAVPPMLTVGKWAARRAKPAPVPDTPEAHARALFHREHCAICHDFSGMPGGDLAAADPSAPDLGGFASREWIAGLLDPDQIRTRKYFGNSKFRGGKMAGFVRDTFSDLDDDEKKEIESLAMAISAEAQLPAQREIDQRDAGRIENGRKLVDTWGCLDCHRFHEEGDHVGPDLTGYGSSEWIRQFICDPANGDSPREGGLLFYGKNNYGMPSYRRFRPEDVAGDSPADLKTKEDLLAKENLNLLTADEIGRLVDLLRGELHDR